jgi:hypothetical protein
MRCVRRRGSARLRARKSALDKFFGGGLGLALDLFCVHVSLNRYLR